MRTINELFRDACLTGRPLAELLKEAGYDDRQTLPAIGKYIVSRNCRGCGEPLTADTFAIWNTYWLSMFAPCHEACRKEGMREEAFECQTIDADCNDCRHFERDKGIKVKDCIPGRCLKFDRPTIAYPNFCTGRPCFEHRRAGG